MKKSFKVLIIMLLATSCSSNKITQTPEKQTIVVPKNEIKSDEFIITSDIGHKIKVEVEYKVLTQDGSVEGCEVGYILTNIGDLDLKSDHFYKGKYIGGEGWKKLVLLNNGEHLKSVHYNPSIIFEIKTSDGKTIETTRDIPDDILIGKSSTPKEIREKVSYASNRYCISFKPIKIQGK